MPKPKIINPERVAGIVALSYLVLIPAAAYFCRRSIKKINHEIDSIWDLLENEKIIDRQFRTSND
jgi:hypothetical protein